ncbi:hypothetical protein H2O64_16245 [Kordia sp. YSTF-M3]|uniref:Right-handed parallel beta-helix repeat-containing protein n=1 Tax=Kordia aestuariivivens TaxID=2759037 RepID=A0ABR7QCI5_9FLAO|nr:hypothetical protein [Kordia aestuariivivens]MBC8756228.1 hypothetical protein [Kordia aestuariivivens]
MKKFLYAFLIFAIAILWSSCRKDFVTVPSSGQLQFSKDTVYLDTIFTNIGSSTYNLKVYNRTDDDIRIPTIQLGEGESSKYRLNVDGIAGKIFQDIELLANDSMFVFVESTIDINDFTGGDQFLYTDAIEFDTGGNEQKVELVTLVQDAVFLFPQQFNDGTIETLLLGVDDEGNESRVEGFFLEDTELNWTNEKPYVVYGYAAVGQNKVLNIEAGARVHFHADSGLIVGNLGSLQVNGVLSTTEVLEGEVIFEGDRLEPGFADVPGQWGTIWLTDGSTNNNINYATIKNASVGILTENSDGTANPTLTLNNSKIYNSSSVGLLARTGHIEANNTVIGSAGQASLYLNLGGRYTFRHCTFANYWTNSFRVFPTVLLDNFLDIGNGTVFTADLVQANFSNCIIDGTNGIELFLDKNNGAELNYNFTNCLIKFNDFNNRFNNNDLYNFSNDLIFDETTKILNSDVFDFKDTAKNEFIIGADSGANGIGNTPAMPFIIQSDILGVPRTNPSDVGAYNHITFDD